MEDKKPLEFSYSPAGLKKWAFIILLTAAYVWIHSGTLGLTHFWLDEIHTAGAARSGSVIEAIRYSAGHDPGGIVYDVIAAAAVRGAGPYESTMRFPALLFGALCIPLMFALMRRLSADGLSLAVPTALFFSPTFLFISMTARGQSLIVLLSLLILISALRPPEAGKSASTAGLILLFTVSLYTDFYSSVILIIAAAALNYRIHGRGKNTEEQTADGTKISPSLHFVICGVAAALLSLPAIVFFPGMLASGPLLWNEIAPNLPPGKKLVINYIGLVGGFTRANMSLVIASAIPMIYGLVHLRRARGRTFTALAVWIAAVAAGAFLIAAGASPLVSLYLMQPLIPILSVFIGASFYYYFVTTFRRDAAAMFSVSLFLRMAVIGLLLLGSFIFMFGYTVSGISDVHYQERQNWWEPVRAIERDSIAGDALVVQDTDKAALSYFMDGAKLKQLDVKTFDSLGSIPDLLAGEPRTWLLIRRPLVPGQGVAEVLNRVFLLDRRSKPYGGMLSNIQLAFVDGYIVSDRLAFRFAPAAGKNKTGSGPINLVCDIDFEPCEIKIFLPEKDTYEFTISARAAAAGTRIAVSICGDYTDLQISGAAKNTIPRELAQGACMVEIAPNRGGVRSIDVAVKKSHPYFPPAESNR